VLPIFLYITITISIIDPDKRKYLRSINQRNGLAVSHIRKSVLDRQSNIWIATSGGGFYKYFDNNFIHYDKSNGLKGNRVYAVHTFEDQIWASNSEAGLIKIDSTGIQKIQQDKGFSEVKIKTITSDTSGNIWAGSEGKGILLKRIQKKDSIVIDTNKVKTDGKESMIITTDTIQVTKYINHIINKRKGLPADWIRTIIVDKDMIWAASYSSGIIRFKYNPERKRLSKIRKFGKRSKIEDLQISDMKQDASGNIWYGTQNGHLGYIKNNKVTHLGNVLNQITSISTIVFYKNTIFLGTAGRGIWWSNTKDISFKKLKGKKELYSDNIYQMIFDNRGNLWAGSERGVDKIEINQFNDIADIFHFGRNDGFLGIETCLNAVQKDTDID